MTQSMENALWRKSKSPLVNEYLQTAKEVEDRAAKQGFLYRPGFLADMTTQVETALKFKLSDLNYEIVKQAIERELAQTGHDYDIAAKEAMIAWELEKAQTLTELAQEFAYNKLLLEMDKEELNRAKIEIDLRQLVIMAAKTAIDIDMELLRQELPAIERSTFSAEDALLVAKLATANKKLEVIPYIEEVLAKQQLIINAETDNADRKGALITAKEDLNVKRLELITARESIAEQIILLIAAKQALVGKKQDLVDARELISGVELTNITYLQQYIGALTGLDVFKTNLITAKNALVPKLNAKSAALIAYAAEIDAWVIVKRAIAAIKEQLVDTQIERVSVKGGIMAARITLNDLENALKEARINLEITRMTGHSDLMTAQIENAQDLLAKRQEVLTSEIQRLTDLLSAQIEYDLYAQTTGLETQEEIEGIDLQAQLTEYARITLAWITQREGEANAAINTEITSKLVHMLS